MIYVLFAGALLAHCAIAASLDKTLLSNGRVYGGENALIDSYPYMISITVQESHNCGGSIIAPNYVLTAAHCFSREMPASWYEVRSGSSFSNESGVMHTIDEVIYYDDYNPSNLLQHDIALVRVAEPFEFDGKCKPIQLFDAGEELEAGSVGVVTGWGFTEYGLPYQLQMLTVPTVSKELCQKIYVSELEGQVCAGYYGIGDKGMCKGDSGGPFAVQGRLAGVISYGNGGCASAEYPVIFSEVAYYRDWIKRHTGV